jgi:cation transport ATPase
VADAIAIGQRSLRIATQSVTAGMALSIVAMGFAGAGLLVPVAGALLQEAIDLAVVLNALRALRG